VVRPLRPSSAALAIFAFGLPWSNSSLVVLATRNLPLLAQVDPSMSYPTDLHGHLHVRQQLCELLPELHAHAALLTNARHDTDDLVQATCERALTQPEQWQPNTSVKDWLLGIMQTEWSRGCREQSAKQHQDQITYSESEEPQDPYRLVAMRDTLRHLEREIQHLPNLSRDLLLMVGVYNVTYKEVASTAGIPIGTAMSRLHRVRRQLVAQLAMMDGAE
jgi:RNA polymerase sigma-70 factor (ECF subfamily)